MILCITEKPSVAKDIAVILGAGKRNDGFFEGNGYCVSWTYGHLCTLKEPGDYTPMWKHWSLSALPMIPDRFGIKLINDTGIKKQFGILKNLIENCDEIINCGDAGQEGELIQRWVIQKSGCQKPVKRLWISSLTDRAIRDGFKNLRPQEDLQPLYVAGLCRAIGDWILGINATRLYTLKYGINRQILSIGRVQTPTLALIVNRQHEIENFIPKDTWELRTLYRNTYFISTIKNFDKEEDGHKILEEIKTDLLTVTDVTQKDGKTAPPRLFDLTSLQVEANRKFGLSADKTLKTIQSLYEKKITTYPRVDTTYLTEDIYPICGGILNSLIDYRHILQNIRGKKLKKSKKVFDNSKVTDHHAIIPTGEKPPTNLTEEERMVFDLIAKRFIAVFFPDMLFKQTVVKAKVGKIDFKATGKVITDPGWKQVYDYDAQEEAQKSTDDEEGVVLPEFQIGENGSHKPMLVKKTSQPPKYYTEGTLLKAMETAGANVDDDELRDALKANGIGRPSTRASIIEILYKRGYIRKERKSLRATTEGINLIAIINEELLKSAKLTGIWEGRLRSIERGEYSAEEFISQLKQMITSITLSVLKDNSMRKIGAPPIENEKEKNTSSRNKKKK